MISPWPALPLSGRQVVVRGAVPDVRRVKPRATTWRPLNGNAGHGEIMNRLSRFGFYVS